MLTVSGGKFTTTTTGSLAADSHGTGSIPESLHLIHKQRQGKFLQPQSPPPVTNPYNKATHFTLSRHFYLLVTKHSHT